MIAASASEGCGAKVRPYSPAAAVEAIAAQSSQVRTERGRAWISIRAAEEKEAGGEPAPVRKLSFPAVIVVDRTAPGAPLLRIEAMDPLGAAHALLILDARSRLTWVDYDERRIDRVLGNWHGVPLSRLPELLLGFLSPPGPAGQGLAGPEGFAVSSKEGDFRYAMDWIDPGPRLAVREIEGTLAPRGGGRERYFVRYSDYLDKDDFYLPREVELKGYGTRAEHGSPLIEIKVSWRERSWNEQIPAKVFTVPAGVLGEFKRD